MVSNPLSRDDLELALEFIGRLHAARDRDSFAEQATSGALELVGGNIASYTEIDEGGGLFSLERPEIPAELLEAFGRYRGQNPLIAHHLASDDPGPTSLSDLASAEHFHATDIYRHFYARLGIEDQIATRLPAPPGSLIAIVVNRPSWGFGPRARALLELVRPHAVQSYALAREGERSRTEIARLGTALERAAAGRPDLERVARRYRLSERQCQVLELLAQGASTELISGRLGIRASTVRKHVENIRAAVGAHSRIELVAIVLGGGDRDDAPYDS